MKKLFLISGALVVGLAQLTAQDRGTLSVADYGSIQEALDKNPGQRVFVPPGDYEISAPIKLATDNSGLYGFGRIIQTSTDAVAISIKAKGVEVSGLTLTRPDGRQDSTAGVIDVVKSDDLVLKDLQILDNHSDRPLIRVDGGTNVAIRDCVIQNYMTLTIEDRTGKPELGYSFRCIDGTGIDVRGTKGALIQGNRITENRLKPTPEIREKYDLGTFLKKNAEKGVLVPQGMWDANYTNTWHQGAGIHLGLGEEGDYVQILGNYIENAAQGIDVQNDHVIVANNIINNAFIGMKALHGARNVAIIGNQFSKNDLWAIGLMPGASSHEAGKPVNPKQKPEESPANIDGGSLIANNIISDFGYGNAYWVWSKGDPNPKLICTPIRLESGPREKSPPLRDVVVEGNVVYDTGKDKILVDGKPQVEPPHYRYAVLLDTEEMGPKNVHFANNIFDPGTAGVSNAQLPP